MISVVVPVRGTEESLERTLASLPSPGCGHEVIIVDSGGGGRSAEFARGHGRLVSSHEAGRGAALDAGAEAARGDTLLFLHADSILPGGAFAQIRGALCEQRVVGGWFRRRLDDERWRYRLVDCGANAFSRMCGLATGDQAIFCRSSAFQSVGGCAGQPLFEDMSLCSKLKRLGRMVSIRAAVRASPRRFYERGIVRTVLRNLVLTGQYFIGRDPADLFRQYYQA